MLIDHPRIYLDSQGQHTDALLIADGVVQATGDAARQQAPDDGPVLRPDAPYLMPALGDAHSHMWGLGLRPGAIDLRGLDADQALQRLAEASDDDDREWIIAVNLDEHLFKAHQSLGRKELDRLFPHRPVQIYRVDRHAIWANSQALQRAGLDDDFQPGDDGEAPRDDDGRLTGYLVDAAMYPVLESLPPTTIQEDREAFFQSARQMRALGIGFTTIARSSVAHVAMLEGLRDEGQLPIHIDVLVAGDDPDFPKWSHRGPDAQAIDGLRIAGVKFYADGALGSSGAHLLEPYLAGGKGLAMHPPGHLQEVIPRLMAQGWQVGVHAIGDAAAREVLDAFEAATDEQRQRTRPRLEHAQMLTDEDCQRLVDMNIIASIQPIHFYDDLTWAPNRLSNEQLRRLYPWHRLKEAPTAFGSDYPIADLNPWHGIATAMTRRIANGNLVHPDRAFDRHQALAAYLDGAAFASHREDHLGKLLPGYAAEVIALDTDPFRAEPEDIWEIEAAFVVPQ